MAPYDNGIVYPAMASEFNTSAAVGRFLKKRRRYSFESLLRFFFALAVALFRFGRLFDGAIDFFERFGEAGRGQSPGFDKLYGDFLGRSQNLFVHTIAHTSIPAFQQVVENLLRSPTRHYIRLKMIVS